MQPEGNNDNHYSQAMGRPDAGSVRIRGNLDEEGGRTRTRCCRGLPRWSKSTSAAGILYPRLLSPDRLTTSSFGLHPSSISGLIWRAVEGPLRDSRFRQWPAGDTYLVYPGARSSIRFERLIEGIQDAEKIRIPREEFAAVDTADSRRQLGLLNTAVAEFSLLEKPAETDALLNHGKGVLEELSRRD